jgi:hypothetical protein
MAADAACAGNGRKIARQPSSSLHPGDSPRSCSLYSSRALPLFAKRTPTVAGRGSRINQHSARTRHCNLGAARQFRSPWSQDVKHCFAGGNEVVGDNPSMAPPPHSLGTHDSTAPCVPGAPELLQTLPEFPAHRIISIIMKAFVLPETVHRPWDEARLVGSTSRLYCGFLRERGTVRTSATSSTSASCSKATKSAIERVACPMVKNGCAKGACRELLRAAGCLRALGKLLSADILVSSGNSSIGRSSDVRRHSHADSAPLARPWPIYAPMS